jgi:polar amino acid transport system permease protein
MSRRRRAQLIRWALYALTLAIVALLVLRTDWGRLQEAMFDPEIARDQFPDILTRAARNTLIFTLYGFSGGLVIGLAVALMRLSSITPYRWFATAYIEVFRGLPALLTIIFIGQGMPIALDARVPGTYGPGGLALAIVSGAYIAETIRAGIEAVPRGQMEAARSLGMGYAQAMVTIVIPQAFRIVIPPLTNELVMLLKDTSLLAVLGVTAATVEITRFGRDDASDTFNATPLVVAGFVYLILTIPLTRVAALLERRVRRTR